jgi:cyclomaltodextrinase / maltogenic alpha-amylase / neopullulanase
MFIKFLSIFIFVSLFINGQSTEKLYPVPEWSKEAIWYQIFPERFDNGDKANDPKIIDMQEGWPYQFPESWKISPWTSDWYTTQTWEQNSEHDFYWNIGARRYGGDIQGIINRLDYIQDLGVTAIYLNPVFESPSLHKYDAAMYHHIDNNFGPDPEGDRTIWASEDSANPASWQWTAADSLFLTLIDECHTRGIKIIIDGVFNHVGSSFWAFKDVKKNQQNSNYKNWFTINKWDDPNTDKDEFEYEGWFGIKDLPEIREDENGIVVSPKEHIKHIIKRWMDPNNDGNPDDGIDGWRLDVADMVQQSFWREFRIWVKEINPNAYITGEIWWDDWDNNKMMNASPWFDGKTFDAVMNYRFTKAVKNFVSDEKMETTSEEFINAINQIRTNYPKENYSGIMNLMGSHDTERFASLTVNPDTWYDHFKRDPISNIRKPNEDERKKQHLMIGLQMTLPGAPMIYYGDEAGMWGGDDPDCRKPMTWSEMNFDDEIGSPSGKERPHDKVAFDSILFSWYQKLIQIRKNNRELSIGELKFTSFNNENKTLVFKRTFDEGITFVAINNSNVAQTILIETECSEMVDLISGHHLSKNNGEFRIELFPYQLIILK